MKNIILLLCLFFFGNSIKAQDISGIVTSTTFEYQIISNTQHNFTFQTYFNLGFQATCPTLINPTFSIVDNTLYVKGYYDITGAWPAAFCNSFDTVTYNYQIPSNITHIITSTNVIGPNNTSPYIPSIITYENVYTRDFDLSLLSINDINLKNITLFPNPTASTFSIIGDLNYNKIIVYNNLGQIVNSCTKNVTGIYDLFNLSQGLYTVVYYDINNLKIGVSKLVKD